MANLNEQRSLVLDSPPVRIRRCRHGLMLFHLNDRYIGRSLDVYGEYSEHEVELFRYVLRPGMTAIDVGANIGAFTLPMAKAVAPTGRVFAYEPQRRLHQMLSANMALNDIGNAWLLAMGAGKENGTAIAPFIDFGRIENFGSVALREAGAGEPVQIAPIDELRLDACHLLKVDVEGMEQDVLAGAASTIARCRPLLYVENALAGKSAALIEQIRAYRYRLYRHVRPLFNPANFFGHPSDIFGAVASYNMLCIPMESEQPQGGKEITGPADWPLEALGKG